MNYNSEINFDGHTSDWIVLEINPLIQKPSPALLDENDKVNEVFRSKSIKDCLEYVWENDLGDTLIAQPY